MPEAINVILLQHMGPLYSGSGSTYSAFSWGLDIGASGG